MGSELNRLTPDAEPSALMTASATLTVLVGAMLCGAALLRFGFIANFISESVLVGFKSGIGLVIVVDQLPKLLGLHVEKAGFFRDLAALLGDIPRTSIATLLPSAGLFSLLPPGRRPQPDGRAGHGGGRAGHPAAAGPLACADAPDGPGRSGDRVLLRADRPRGVPRDPARAPCRIQLGCGGLPRGGVPGHPQGHPGGRDPLPAGAGAAGGEPAGVCHRPQARH
ncbi:hypothetical protein KQ310_04955 [Synechococcus sp. CS-1328]|nr:hypothetical protein [Synechococcus sp. CS-1328]